MGGRTGWLMDDECEECVTHEPCFCVEACVPDVELALYLLDHVDIRLCPGIQN